MMITALDIARNLTSLFCLGISCYMLFWQLPRLQRTRKMLNERIAELTETSAILGDTKEKNVQLRKELEGQIATWKARNAELTSSAWH